MVPSVVPPNGVIAAHWSDLSARSPQLCVAVVGAAPARRMVIEWPDATYFDQSVGARLTFEAVLHEGTGVIDLTYRAMTGARAATTGLERLDGRAGARPSIEVFASCVDTPADNCQPLAGTVYRFIPST